MSENKDNRTELRGILVKRNGKIRFVVLNQDVTLLLSDPDGCPFMDSRLPMRAPDISKQVPDDDDGYDIAMIQYATPKAILKQILEEVIEDTEEGQK